MLLRIDVVYPNDERACYDVDTANCFLVRYYGLVDVVKALTDKPWLAYVGRLMDFNGACYEVSEVKGPMFEKRTYVKLGGMSLKILLRVKFFSKFYYLVYKNGYSVLSESKLLAQFAS